MESGARRCAADLAPALVLIGGLIAVSTVLTRGAPSGLYGLGVVSGAGLALQAAGVVLTYRTDGVVNFAQVQLGVVAASLFAELVEYRPALRGLTAICPSCRVTPATVALNYWAALVLALGFAAALGWAVHRFVIRRFARENRLLPTVATVFLAQLLGGLQGLLPTLLGTASQRSGGVQLAPAHPPVGLTLHWGIVTFHAPDLFVVVAAAGALLAIAVTLRRTLLGAAIRASGEHPEVLRSLGVDVDRLRGRVWAVAALLSAVPAITGVMTQAPPARAGLDAIGTLHILLIAVIAGLTSIPLACLAALSTALLSQALLWRTGSGVLLDPILLGAVVALLLVRRDDPFGRATDAAAAMTASTAQETPEARPRPVPAELRSLPAVRTLGRLGSAVAAISVLAFPWLATTSQTNLGSLALIYGVVLCSLLLLTGWAGFVSLGQFGFAACGAYVAAVVSRPFPVALALGALAGAGAAVVVGLPALRMRGLELAVTSLGFAVVVANLLVSRGHLGRYLPQRVGRPAVFGFDLGGERSFYYLTLAVAVAALAFVAALRRSRAGRDLVAARDNPAAAQAFGVNVVANRLAAFAVSGLLAGLAGGLLAFHQTAVTASAFAPEVSVTVFVAAVVGGLGSVLGAILGTLYLGTMTLLSANAVVVFLVTGGGGLLLLLLAPAGLTGVAVTGRNAWLFRLALRHDVPVSLGVGYPPTPLARRAPIAPLRPAAGFDAVVRVYAPAGTDGANDV